MWNYEYVTKKEIKPYYNNLLDLLHAAQKDFVNNTGVTFRYDFNVGSYGHNMVTRLVNGNQGFDIDGNIRINTYYNDDPATLKHDLMWALNRNVDDYGFLPCEDSTRVITLKMIDRRHSRIIFSCDLAIVDDFRKQGTLYQRYIHYDKTAKKYQWREQSQRYYNCLEYADYCKNHDLWQEVRDKYIEKKDKLGPDVESREVYAQTLQSVYDSHHNH